MKTIPTLALLLAFILAGCATQKSQPAVMPFSGTAHPQKLAVIAIPKEGFAYPKYENLFIECLVHKGYQVVGRTDLEHVLQQQKIDRNMFHAEAASKVGKLLGVDALLFLEATEMSEGAVVNGHQEYHVRTIAARVVDVETGSVIWIQNTEKDSLPLVIDVALLPYWMLAGGGKSAEAEAVAKVMQTFPTARN